MGDELIADEVVATIVEEEAAPAAEQGNAGKGEGSKAEAETLLALGGTGVPAVADEQPRPFQLKPDAVEDECDVVAVDVVPDGHRVSVLRLARAGG